MPINILMPALSPTMTEGTLTRWLKTEGEAVASGDPLAEIETDKATMEIEAVEEGTLGRIFVAEGTTGVAVNTVIAALLEDGESADAITQPSPPAPPSPASPPPDVQKAPRPPKAPDTPPTAVASPGDRVFASPLARRIARDKNLDLTRISGSGPHGRVVLRDVENLTPTSTPATALLPGDLDRPSPSRIEPLSPIRTVIAERLSEAKRTIPHFYLSTDCTVDRLLDLRQQINEGLDKAQKISVNDFVIKACAAALIQHPKANACTTDGGIELFDHADIAIAVSIPDGLITPIVRRADGRPLSNIAQTTKDLVQRARDGKLAPQEFQGGSFTISNLGMYGVDQFQAVINPPQACILAVGRSRSAPVVTDNGGIGVANLMNITLSVDHRAVDGALAAELLDAIKFQLENPARLLLT